MEKEDIERLATLARIELTDEEAISFATEITSILGYVSEIDTITGSTAGEKQVGAVYNVFREDANAHEGGTYTEDILGEAPDRVGRYIQVKKILGNP